MKINPNLISALRLPLAGTILICQQLNTTASLFICLVAMAVSEVSDILDGRIARQCQLVSNLGKIFDPYCDSVVRFLLFLGFLASGWMPVWMVALIFVRDITVAYIRIFAANHGVLIAARTSGKIKALVQAPAQFVVVTHHFASNMGYVFLPDPISWSALLLATIITMWSMIDYLYFAYRTFKKTKRRLNPG